MLSYRFKCRKSTEGKNSKVVKTKNGRIMLLSRCEVYENKTSKFDWMPDHIRIEKISRFFE